MKKMESAPIDQTNIAVINTNISYIQKDMSEIKVSIKELSGVYATKLFVDDGNKGMNLRIEALEKSSNMWRWLSPTMSAILGSILTFLIISYLAQLKP